MTCECEKNKPEYNFWTSYNVFNALKDTVLSVFGKKDVWAAREVRDSRFAICDSCPQKKFGRCEICGCIIGMKVRYTGSSCPKGKW